MTSFWQNLPQNFIGLSPMDGITDYPFRAITHKYGQPDLMYTEFVSVEGIAHKAKQFKKDFLIDDHQHPIVAQIFGNDIDSFKVATQLINNLNFDGIDINMGCPAKKVADRGAGAGLINNPQLAKKIVTVVQNETDLPVSIKTRIGYDQPIIDEWISTLLELEPAAIAIHGRTFKQGYSGLANWDEIGKAVELAKNSTTLIIGNGDVKSKKDALEKIEKFGLDGVLIGRAAMGNPWVFKDQQTEVDQPTRSRVALKHAQLFEQTFSQFSKYSFLPMRKHLGWYIKGFEYAKQIRVELMQTENCNQVAEIFAKYQFV